MVTIAHTHTQPFDGLLSGTTRVGWYRKKHSPTHTHPDYRTSFITFLHLQRSMASTLFILRAWQSSRTTSLQVLFGLPLGLGPRFGGKMHNNKHMSKIIWLGPHRRCAPSFVLSLYFAVDGHVPSKVSVPLPVAGQNPHESVHRRHINWFCNADRERTQRNRLNKLRVSQGRHASTTTLRVTGA